jgi:hypothetical protein
LIRAKLPINPDRRIFEFFAPSEKTTFWPINGRVLIRYVDRKSLRDRSFGRVSPIKVIGAAT